MGILVFIEGAGDELSQQAVAFARGLHAAGDVEAVVVDDGVPYAPAAWAAAVVDAVRERAATVVLGPGSDRGNELLAHVAAILDLPLAANCIAVTPAVGGTPASVTRVRWGGSLLEEARVHGSPLLATVAAHAVVAEPLGLVPSELAPAIDGALAVSERVQAVTAGVSLTSAPVVVSGGRGVGSSEGFAVIEELAELLGGAVGCSRAVTSAGWRPHSDQVGQTGTKVSPDLYIACGISGATQHMAGCKGAKKLLAINPDAEASIFASADYGVIGDLHEIVPAISAELRKARSR
jgi:electron transfer flavoprotein alpha subunit